MSLQPVYSSPPSSAGKYYTDRKGQFHNDSADWAEAN